MRRLGIGAALLFGLSTAGCAPTYLTGASQVGGDAPSTWIYLKTDDAAASGIYRCRDSGATPRCVRASISSGS